MLTSAKIVGNVGEWLSSTFEIWEGYNTKIN